MVRAPRAALVALVAALLLILPAPLASRGQEATPTSCPSTTPAENAALVTRYLSEVWARGGEAATADHLAPDVVHHWGIGSHTTGIDAFTERLALFLVAFPDIAVTVDLVAAEGDRVAARWTTTGTHRGDWQGIAPTDRQVRWSGITSFRIECGQIAESWSEAHHIGLRQQLGATDVPPMLATPVRDRRATPAAVATACIEDTPEGNVAIARRWTEDALNDQNLDVLDELLAPEAVHHSVSFPDAHGPEAIKAGLGRLLEAFPDMTLSVEETIAEGDLVVVRWSGSGTHQGPWIGLEGTGRTVEFTGINLYRLHCSTIVESWSEVSGLDLLRQLTE